jgi:anti-sigma regulatory factor (Ser/Thr protein kinase)
MGASDRLRVTLPSHAANLPLVRHAIRGFLSAGHVSDPPVGEVLLAVTEACANVVQHAYADADQPGELELELERTSEELRVAVRDRGRGFAPRPDSPGAGLGLPVIASLTQRLEIRPVDGKGTEVMMAFSLNEAA